MEFLFPHEKPRKVQESLMRQVYSTLQNKGSLLVHAPTGIGKSAAALAPALTYVLKEDPKKIIFFLTARNTQHIIAIETLQKIKEKENLNFVVVDLIGKKNMCNQSGVQLLNSGEFTEYCKDLREKGNCQYYTNLRTNGKLSAVTENVLINLRNQSPMHVEDIKNTCSSADLCSYEMACLLGKDAKVIVADYNYMLNTFIRDNLLKKINKDLKDCIIIFDEGHNVPHRSRDLLTGNISSFILDYAAKEAKNEGFKEMGADVIAIRDAIEKMARDKLPVDKQEVKISKMDFVNVVNEIGTYDEIVGNLAFVSDQVLEKKRRSFTQAVSNFMEKWLGPDKGFVRILSREYSTSGPARVKLSYRCLDPSLLFSDIQKESHAVIVMSGTLTPLAMYADLLGLTGQNALEVEYDNPFPSENRLDIILPETSTKYKSRSKLMYEKIASKCSQVTNIIPGNVVIFFPSYFIRDQVYEFLRDRSEKTMFLEESGNDKRQRTILLEKFKNYNKEGAVLLAVAGGSFSEGVDLPGDLLKGVVVVGLPLGMPDLETKELIDYYDLRFGKGWDYGYVYPAIIKILQSAGRCIRSETDRGVVVFLDERYAWSSYKRCFPKDLNLAINRNPKILVKNFFSLSKK
jgi:DNA excision repair protein ERCC-2